MTADRSFAATWLAAASACLSILAAAEATPAQQPAERRLGVFLWHDSPNDLATLDGIRLGLAQSGVRHTFLEHRADSDPTKADAALRSLRDAKCDLIFALGTQAALLAKDAIVDVPVVFAAVSDPVASGVVPDWTGSGNNLCGCSNWIAPANVLDVFLMAAPRCHRLGVIRSRTTAVVATAELVGMRAHLAAANAPPVSLHEVVAADEQDVGAATTRLLAEKVDAIWIPIDITIYRNVAAVRRAVGPRGIPLLTTSAVGVRAGAHVGAAIDYTMHGRRAAAMAIDVLVRGRRPANLPIDRMHGTLVGVNLATARADGVELPLSLLALADELFADDTSAREVRDDAGKR